MATEQTEDTRLRLAIIGVVCIALFASLFVRLWYLQAIDRRPVEVATARAHLRTVHEQGPRGRILDRNGKVLVDNKVVIVVGIDKQAARSAGLGDGDPKTEDDKAAVVKRKKTFQKLAVLLTDNELRTKATNIERLFEDPRYRPIDFVPIVDAGAAQIEELELYLAERQDEYPGVAVKRRSVRWYPYGELAAHMLGYVGRIIPEELEAKQAEQGSPGQSAGSDSKPYAADDEIGKSGIERSFEKYLRGKPGDTEIQVDARGQYLKTTKEAQLTPGDDVWLTIDINVQALAEQQLRSEILARNPTVSCEKTKKCNAREGSVVITDPSNGQILAMASYPTFDPSRLVNGISTELWEQLTSEQTLKPMLNRAVAAVYEPGSTFKLVSTYAALDRGLVRPSDVIVDSGSYKLENCSGGKCEFSNAGKVALGSVDLRRALTVSSDVYYYRIGDLLWKGRDVYGDTPIQDAAELFGFGQKSGVALPSESSGLIGTPAWLKGVYDKNPKLWDHGDWKVGDTLNTSIGQGLVNVTPLQLANAYATFANGGTRYVPQIAFKVTRPQDMSKPPSDPENSTGVALFGPEVAEIVGFDGVDFYNSMYQGLQGVTGSGAGTAGDAFQDSPTVWPMAGKTGTAQVTNKADTSVFVGWGPANMVDAPRFAIAAILPEAGFGADAAAPLAFRILQPVSRGTVPAQSPSRYDPSAATATASAGAR